MKKGTDRLQEKLAKGSDKDKQIAKQMANKTEKHIKPFTK